MTPKSLVLTVSMLAFVAISGEAVAAAQTVQRRHPIAEARQFGADIAQQPDNAFDTFYVLPPQVIDRLDHRYEGGPKSDIY
jgi:hypothetical protein